MRIKSLLLCAAVPFFGMVLSPPPAAAQVANRCQGVSVTEEGCLLGTSSLSAYLTCMGNLPLDAMLACGAH